MKSRGQQKYNRILNILGLSLLIALPLYFYNDYRSTRLEAATKEEGPQFFKDDTGVDGIITIGPNGVIEENKNPSSPDQSAP